MKTEKIIEHMEYLVTQAQEGETSEMNALLQINIILKKASELRDIILPNAISELENSITDKQKSYTFNGYRFSKKETVKYDYSNEPRIKQLENEISNIKEQMKAAQKAAENNRQIVDDDGVIIPPAIKYYGKESITITKIK